jgi:phage terminase large subunit-like protein
MNKAIHESKGYYQYAYDVLADKIVTGELIKAACKRFTDDLKRSDLYFDENAVDRAIRFISTLKHYTGKFNGKPFVLQPWQQFIVANIVGFYHKDNAGNITTRKYTSSYIEVSRKNGKTALASALCLYFLIADGENGAEVDLAANSKEQAKIAFGMCSAFVKQLDAKQKYLKAYRDKIKFNKTDSVLNVFSSDDSTLDGFNASFALVDEYHSAKNSKVRDVIKSSMGMRNNPHLCTITTAGFDKTLPCFKLRTTAIEVLNGIKEDDSMFVAIYAMNDNDDWTNENNWVKCTPNLDVTVTTKYIKEQVQSAINNPSEEVGVRTKTLNQWCDSAQTWIADRYIHAATQKINLFDERFYESNCYIGVDLAAVGDLTAVAYLIPHEDALYVKVDYYLPESALQEGVNKELYKYWRSTNQLKITHGNVTDYDFILNDLVKANNHVLINKVAYDKWNSTQWAINATDLGLPLEEYSQSIGNFNKPTRELERLLLSGKVVIDNNEITRWCFSNVQLKADHNGNIKPNKGTSQSKKIDGVIAMIQALGVYLDTPQYTGSISVI